MQLLTLIDLIGTSREISFNCITERLGIQSENIEEFIIDGIEKYF